LPDKGHCFARNRERRAHNKGACGPFFYAWVVAGVRGQDASQLQKYEQHMTI
jgi:hypothetical protein